ncbi:short-chain dehydrogenase [Anaerobacillus arseniciselenatis]|uniref:Short-chain dehydrogenase n=1 Tax=Anaerobacillus arseniciselenatis TaxID=85682 RepID=A0A1S2LL82_9BACI|nr:SDR family NAD(P)-dependent oxidoreductase [Anaerobacillus arseniciselenatis]OIJ12843.1 short-chain dehydrogenase [Anaerobacillus arseniciselenatis]
MKKRTVIITGANSGIGKAATLQFAKEGYTVIMACRNIEKSEKVHKDIIEATQNRNVELMKLDASSFQSIHQFCEEFKKRYETLDILIHNAAYFNHGAKYCVSDDGIEMTFNTNVVGPYLITCLLLDQLKKSDDARILNAGSNIIKHFFDPKKKIEFSNLQGENNDPKYSVYKMYCQSKMALMLLTFKMADEFKNHGIKVNALQINGATMSKETLQKVTLRYRLIARVQNRFFRPPSYMANNYYEICTSENYKDTTGKLFNDKLEIMEAAPKQPQGFIHDIKQVTGSSLYPYYADDPTMTNEVWEFCERVTGKSIDDYLNSYKEIENEKVETVK